MYSSKSVYKKGKNIMKKIIAAAVALNMVFALYSCGHKHETHLGKCAKCGEYVLDELYVPTYEDYTACKNSSSIPSWLTVSETNTETDRKILECTSSEKKFPDDSKNSVISIEYAEFDNEEIISDISVSYTLNDSSLIKEIGDAIVAEMDRRYGKHSETSVYGGDFEWIHDNSGIESVSVLNIEDDCIRISERETAPENVRDIQKEINSLNEEFVPEKEEDFSKVLEKYRSGQIANIII